MKKFFEGLFSKKPTLETPEQAREKRAEGMMNDDEKKASYLRERNMKIEEKGTVKNLEITLEQPLVPGGREANFSCEIAGKRVNGQFAYEIRFSKEGGLRYVKTGKLAKDWRTLIDYTQVEFFPLSISSDGNKLSKEAAEEFMKKHHSHFGIALCEEHFADEARSGGVKELGRQKREEEYKKESARREAKRKEDLENARKELAGLGL